jgi:hypothetical protein
MGGVVPYCLVALVLELAHIAGGVCVMLPPRSACKYLADLLRKLT